MLISKRVCDHVTHSNSIGNSFKPCGTLVHNHMRTTRELLIIWQMPLAEKRTRPLGALLV